MGESRSQGELPEGVRGGRGRRGATRKMDLVLRILKGEDLDALSPEVKVMAARLARWRDEALASMQTGLKSREVGLLV